MEATVARTLSNKTLSAPALGTPISGVMTNVTGTASGLTAGNVTTNANMTGDVTSVGNATTLAAGSASNLNSGTLPAARMPALTGDVTTSSGAVATTIGAGKVTEAMQVLADNTTQDVSSTKHGYVPKSAADATKFLNSATTPVFAQVKDSDLSTSDITTNDFSTTKHGFVPKGPNTGKFLKDDGTWATVSGSGSVATDAIWDAKGDLAVATGADAAVRKAVGSDGQVLTADAASTGGVKWATVSGTGDALTSNPLSQFASTTSLQLKGVLSDETGSGAAVFATSPALTTPTGIVKSDVGLGNVDNTSDATKQAAILAVVYPVGSIYTATVSTNPATLFGFGTWVAAGAGRVLVGKAGAGTFSTGGATGGAETVASNVTVATQPTFTVDSHTHTGPSHTHTLLRTNAWAQLTVTSGGLVEALNVTATGYTSTRRVTGTGSSPSTAQTTGVGLDGATEAGGTGSTGTASVATTTRTADVALTNNATSVLQPWLVVYIWERTA